MTSTLTAPRSATNRPLPLNETAEPATANARPRSGAPVGLLRASDRPESAPPHPRSTHPVPSPGPPPTGLPTPMIRSRRGRLDPKLGLVVVVRKATGLDAGLHGQSRAHLRLVVVRSPAASLHTGLDLYVVLLRGFRLIRLNICGFFGRRMQERRHEFQNRMTRRQIGFQFGACQCDIRNQAGCDRTCRESGMHPGMVRPLPPGGPDSESQTLKMT
jgi:hypothetical protein